MFLVEWFKRLMKRLGFCRWVRASDSDLTLLRDRDLFTDTLRYSSQSCEDIRPLCPKCGSSCDGLTHYFGLSMCQHCWEDCKNREE